MNEKELREIKRRFRPDRSNISKIVGCFCNTNGEIVSKISQPLYNCDSAVCESLLKTMKKALSGNIGTNLTNIAFSTSDVLNSPEHKLLMRMRNSGLSDTEALDEFYDAVRQSVKFESNYVILLASDVYDVFSYSSDGERGESEEIFSYIVCAICPLKSSRDALSFRESDSLFQQTSASETLASCELGFMFPAFDMRKTNIYNALYYVRSTSESYPDFTEKIFKSGRIMPPKEQMTGFSDCLSESLGEDCSLPVVRALQTQVEAMIEEHKESKNEEPLTVSKPIVKRMLENCGIEEEKIKKLEEQFDENFGINAEIPPKNLIETKTMVVKTPELKIKIDGEHRDIISTEVINGVKYIMIKAEGEITVNGVRINMCTSP